MCKRCTELDDKIEHYKRISTITDQLTLDGIAGLIKQMLAEKAALIPSKSREGSFPVERSSQPITLCDSASHAARAAADID